MVYSSTTVTSLSSSSAFPLDFFKQVIFVVLGVGIIVLIVNFLQDDDLLVSFTYAFWFFCFILFLLTFIAGIENYGARRWLNLGIASIQPSELMKIALVLIVAEMSINFRKGQYSYADIVIKVLIFIVIPLVMVVGPNGLRLQSDLGSTMIMLLGMITAMALGGAKKKTVILVVLGVFLLGFIAIVSQPYRMDRLSMVNPWESADDESYQLIRSLKALAAGGLIGKGIGASYESFLTFSQSDFIFAIVGEEMGFIGAVAVLVAFALIGYGGFRIAGRARSDYHMVIAGGLTAMIVAQALLNVASVIGVGPTTGKPLPFLSAGGSSMISSMGTLGFLLMISICSDPTRGARERRENNLQVVSSDSLKFEEGYGQRPSYHDDNRRGRQVAPPLQNRTGTVNLANPVQRSSKGTGYPSPPRRKDPSNDLDYSRRRNSRYR